MERYLLDGSTLLAAMAAQFEQLQQQAMSPTRAAAATIGCNLYN